jgi:hypothetical protein
MATQYLRSHQSQPGFTLRQLPQLSWNSQQVGMTAQVLVLLQADCPFAQVMVHLLWLVDTSYPVKQFKHFKDVERALDG